MSSALPNGNLWVPFTVEGDHGEVGEGWAEIGPDHPLYAQWSVWLERADPASLRPDSGPTAE